jgi:hypothetical protein
MTATWTDQELAEIDARDELQIASLRSDGTLSSARTIWAVREGDRVYVRSVNGPGAAWFRSTRGRREGRISVGTLTKDVTFVDIDEADAIEDRLDAAYRGKYRGYAKSIVDSINSAKARSATIELVPRPTES